MYLNLVGATTSIVRFLCFHRSRRKRKRQRQNVMRRSTRSLMKTMNDLELCHRVEAFQETEHSDQMNELSASQMLLNILSV